MVLIGTALFTCRKLKPPRSKSHGEGVLLTEKNGWSLERLTCHVDLIDSGGFPTLVEVIVITW